MANVTLLRDSWTTIDCKYSNANEREPVLDNCAGSTLHGQNSSKTEDDVLFAVEKEVVAVQHARQYWRTFGEVQPLSLPVSLTPMYLGAWRYGAEFGCTGDGGWERV